MFKLYNHQSILTKISQKRKAKKRKLQCERPHIGNKSKMFKWKPQKQNPKKALNSKTKTEIQQLNFRVANSNPTIQKKRGKGKESCCHLWLGFQGRGGHVWEEIRTKKCQRHRKKTPEDSFWNRFLEHPNCGKPLFLWETPFIFNFLISDIYYLLF